MIISNTVSNICLSSATSSWLDSSVDKNIELELQVHGFKSCSSQIFHVLSIKLLSSLQGEFFSQNLSCTVHVM